MYRPIDELCLFVVKLMLSVIFLIKLLCMYMYASSDRLRVWFLVGFFSKDGLALFNLTAHELHGLYYDRPTS